MYARLLRARVRGLTQYRASFAIDLVTQTTFTALDFASMLVMFRVTPSLGGFTFRQVLFIGALAGTSFALADLVVGNVEQLQLYVRTGLLDAVLMRPMSVLGQLLVLDFAPRRIGRFVFPFVLLVYLTATAGIEWTPERAVLLAVTPLCGAVFFSGVYVIGASVAFWWIDSGQFANSFTYGGRDFTSYPVNVFKGWFRNLFAFGLGFAFVAYYPALGILGIPDPLALPSFLTWGGPFAAALATGLATLVWRTGLRHYKGAGS